MLARLLLAVITCSCAHAQLDTIVTQPVRDVSRDRILANIEKLVDFGERTPYKNGSNGAPEWIMGEFRSYSPKLQVEISEWASSNGLPPIRNVIAILPGTTMPEKQILLTAHYDSRGGVGASDNAAGAVAVMEAARVLSQHSFPKTLVFIAFDAEEYGLLGSKVEANDAKKEGRQIEAVLNADIVGNGPRDGDEPQMRLYGGVNLRSTSMRLALYVKEVAERHTTMSIEVVPQQDPPAHGGDQVSYQNAGYAAIRLITPHETRSDHHSTRDTIEKVSIPYTALAARVMVSAAASLALGLE